MRFRIFACLAFFIAVFFARFSLADMADTAAPKDIEDQIRHLQHLIDAQQNNSNHIWTMIAAALVAFMQGGFLLLESGMVRSKNSINVAQKNISDFILSIIVFTNWIYVHVRHFRWWLDWLG